MPNTRRRIRSIDDKVLLASRRRCCLCFFLDGHEGIRRGQIAHLNHKRTDARFDNLAFLCLEHHDEYDSRTSTSRALSIREVKKYRDDLYLKNPDYKSLMQDEAPPHTKTNSSEESSYERLRRSHANLLDFTNSNWRFPLWQVANEPEFFAYKAPNRADGICLIERIDIPNGQIVIACIQTAGNPGNSITNCVEALCFQVCERFDLAPDRLVWLEHYDERDDEWRLVTFDKTPPKHLFENPKWTVMTREMWRKLKLRPKKKLRLKPYSLGFESKITKLFNWPTENLF